MTHKILDPTQMEDWQIAEAAEETMKPFVELGRETGLEEHELIPHGKWLGKVDYRSVLDRLGGASQAKYVDVTAITPTPEGEGQIGTATCLVRGRVGVEI